MKTVFAVSSGSYSDYGVICVCHTAEMAEAIANKINLLRGNDHWSGRDRARVEEMPLMESPEDIFITTMYGVHTDLAGKELRRWTFQRQSWNDYEVATELFGDRVIGVSDRGYEQALKSARDVLAQSNAEEIN